MATKKITSLEVAKLAGVSQSAVSRVFTPGASSSKKTEGKSSESGYGAWLPTKRFSSIINYRSVTHYRSSGCSSG